MRRMGDVMEKLAEAAENVMDVQVNELIVFWCAGNIKMNKGLRMIA